MEKTEKKVPDLLDKALVESMDTLCEKIVELIPEDAAELTIEEDQERTDKIKKILEGFDEAYKNHPNYYKPDE